VGITVFTYPTFFSGEAEIVNKLFDEGLETLHVRKPSCSEDDLKLFIQSISLDHYSKIVLHSHYNLKNEFPVKGLHLSRFNVGGAKEKLDDKLSVSFSTHSRNEILEFQDEVDYCFLSPIYNSISKEGYKSAFSRNELVRFFNSYKGSCQVLALGGIESCRIEEVKDIGFHGVALLGAIWQDQNMKKAVDEFQKVKELWEVVV
jgi:thiamine-phosphate pyrophosphorylase